MIGTIVLDSVAVTSKNAPGLLIAFYLANFVIVNGNLLWSIVTRNVAGQSKKTTVLTLMFIFYAVGAIIGPQVFVASDAPRYHNAFAAHIALYGMCALRRIDVSLKLTRSILLYHVCHLAGVAGETKQGEAEGA